MVTSLVGMVFTQACALALKGGWRPAGRRRGLQAQGPVGEGLVAIDLPADVHAGTAKSALWCSPTPNTSKVSAQNLLRIFICLSHHPLLQQTDLTAISATISASRKVEGHTT
jgi:hypothetical protein